MGVLGKSGGVIEAVIAEPQFIEHVIVQYVGPGHGDELEMFFVYRAKTRKRGTPEWNRVGDRKILDKEGAPQSVFRAEVLVNPQQILIRVPRWAEKALKLNWSLPKFAAGTYFWMSAFDKELKS